jgi:hypothetical protein
VAGRSRAGLIIGTSGGQGEAFDLLIQLAYASGG